VQLDEVSHPGTEQRADEVGAGPSVRVGIVRHDDVADIVYQTGHLELEIVGMLGGQDGRALEVVVEGGQRLGHGAIGLTDGLVREE
jgi:hypothetical protein